MDYALDFHLTIGTIVCIIAGFLSYLSGAGAVLPKMGRTGLSTQIISAGMFLLAILSSITISF